MKNCLASISLAVLVAAGSMFGCEPEDCEKNHTGIISMENTSGDVFYLIVDGENTGKVYPFDTGRAVVDVGEHYVEIKNEGGGDVCQPITVYVDECEVEGMCCPICD